MDRQELDRIIAGFRRFHERYYGSADSPYQKLSEGQSPQSLVIGCSDSRVDPAIVTDAGPGDIFVVRNVANLVPPFETGGGNHGTSAAIEFAVVNLKVKNVIVMGHRNCGGIRALVTGVSSSSDTFIDRWVSIARPAHFRTLAAHPNADADELCRHCEMESIKISLDNLRTFPFVKQAIAERGLSLIGAYFDMDKGAMFEFTEENSDFREVVI